MTALSKIQLDSILYGKEHFEETKAQVLRENPVLNSEDASKYLSWYVNERTLDFGDDGRKALEILFSTAYEKKLINHKINIEII